ncbi:cellulose binding domain-containing protein [Umezawaea endophytica]|uniref:Cellulose binding domain-containing protein n=1 Tax=Umezawaea endophytica TaxID=1654476 RepID=A0A9X2VK63_9PSEU|nr:cellulose binding domain-containing protein [Umezawaea endophytica]MCS7477577.1 cellulose binding domain-containing protein [Umezawaea endophytica]
MSNPLAQLAFRVSLTIAAIGVCGAVLAAAVGLVLLAALPSTAAGTQVCGKNDVVPAGEKEYLAGNNVGGVDTAQCVTVGERKLRVDSAEHDLPVGGPPAASPSLLKGCHQDICSENSGLPVQVSRMPELTSNLVTTPAADGDYATAYTAWFHSKPAVEGLPDGAEMAIWLRANGDARPAGIMVAGAMPISGASWDVWFEKAQGRNRITYERVGDVDSVRGLDIRAFGKDAVNRAWVKPDWYLIGVEAGFDLWRGGAGNSVDEFEVVVAEQLPPVGPAACTASLAIDTSWPQGFTATIKITNSGARPVEGWTVDWTFPGEQRVENSWNATITQKGRTVHAVNAAYNGLIDVQDSITFGLVGIGAPPKTMALTCVPR